MIFITIGTHDQQFTRLVRRMDEIAPKIKEEIIIQRGYTKYTPKSKNCKNFEWASSLEECYKRARVVISHGGSSVWEFAYKYKKPLIIVPRRFEYKEHINNHQVEFAKSFCEKTGIAMILEMKELTPEFLKKYKKIAGIDNHNLKKLQNFMRRLIEKQREKIKNE